MIVLRQSPPQDAAPVIAAKILGRSSQQLVQMPLRVRYQTAGRFRRCAASQARGLIRLQLQRPPRTAQSVQVSPGLGVEAGQNRQERRVLLRRLLQCREAKARVRSVTAQQQGLDELECRLHVIGL